MIDIKYIKENPEEVIARYAVKGKDAREDITKILELDAQRRALIVEGEHYKNIGGADIGNSPDKE